jgi:hypothetical protein
LVRQEVAQKMQEIKNVMEEIATPEMKERIEKIREALEELDWEEIKRNLKDFKLTQEELLQRLEQALAMLKRIQAEQKLDAMTKLLEQMAERQAGVNRQIDQADKESLSELTEQERNLGQNLESVAEQFEEFKQLMQEMPLLSPEDLQNMEAALNQPENQQSIGQMSRQLNQGQRKSARQTGEKLSSSFQQAARTFGQMAEKISQDQQQKLAADLRNALQDVLYLSGKQEELADKVKESYRLRQTLRDLAAWQVNLMESTEKVSNNLEEVMKESGAVPRKLTRNLGICASRMSQAASELANRNSSSALNLQNQAMAGLNEVAKDLLQAFDQSCNNPGQGMCSNPSLAQGLESLSRQQQGINRSTDRFSDLLQDMMMPSQDQIQRLAAQQGEVQKGLDDLLKEYSESANALGRLDRLAAEIKEAVRKLEHGELDQELRNRQNQILNRLLDAQKSLYTQDFSNQRRAETGEDVLRRSPAELELRDRQGRSGRPDDLQEEKYPRQYEELIKGYFKALQQNGVR